jgi:hypothetical protein
MKVASLSRPLPSFMESAISSIRWPLDLESHLPLQLKSLEQIQATSVGSTSNHQHHHRCLDALHPLAASQLPTTLKSLFFDDYTYPPNRQQQTFGIIACALILIGNGCIDEAHSIITPLSWPEPVHFGYIFDSNDRSAETSSDSSPRGQPQLRYADIDEISKTYAMYTHSLVHRYEAFHVGEFGMMGWDNANYWSSATAKSPAYENTSVFPHADWFRVLDAAVRDCHDPFLTQWAQEHKIFADSPFYFDNRAVHILCRNVMSNFNNSHDSTFQMTTRANAERIADLELRVALSYALTFAGFENCSVERIVSCSNAPPRT